jgi:peroxiredoxin Q/BCP
MSTVSKRPPLRRPPTAGAATPPARRRRLTFWAAGTVAAAIALAVLYSVFSTSPTRAAGKGATYGTGSPGIGQAAPDFTLKASTGKNIALQDFHGKNVLLYFQEGLTCQPCWDQLSDLEKSAPKLKAAGIDQVVSITTDPADLIARKTRDMRLTTPVLSDPDLAVSKAYHANDFGMMGSSRDGHSFLLVGPDGAIRWRADYGGAPDYTMYVPVSKLLTDLKTGIHS